MTTLSSGSKYFLRDSGADEPRLGLAQSFWALTDRDVTRAQALEDACSSGFEYFEVGLREERFEATRQLLTQFPLKLIAQGWAVTAEEAFLFIERAVDFAALALNLHLGHAYLSTSEAVDLIGIVERRAQSLGMPLLLETHRGRLTQDLFRFARVVVQVPEVVITLDVSHYVVAGETFGGAENLFHSSLEPLIARTAMIHGRISNGQSIQVSTDNASALTSTFQAIWRRTMEVWLKDAPSDGIFLFEPELGPVPYAYLDGSCSETFSRTEQSRVLTSLAQQAWASARASHTRLGETRS